MLAEKGQTSVISKQHLRSVLTLQIAGGMTQDQLRHGPQSSPFKDSLVFLNGPFCNCWKPGFLRTTGYFLLVLVYIN